jgi:hypothetical protein
MPDKLLDVRALTGSRELIAYHDGGLFPVLTTTPSGTVVAVLRGGAGHLGVFGRIEVIRSLDAGRTWSPPNVVADSDRDDRNPAFGTSNDGTLILAYHRQCCYDEAGTYVGNQDDEAARVEIVVTRSHDDGLSWEKPALVSIDPLQTGSPFGKIVSLDDGTLLMPIYIAGSYFVRSRDDGATWAEPTLIAAGMNETALLVLPNGDILAVMRSRGLSSAHSRDGGRTWSDPVQVTEAGQHPADLIQLSNGDILLTYGNRNPPYRIEGRISRDGGRSWLDSLLTFSGHLYGYNAESPRPSDLGYPSSTLIQQGSAAGQGVTMYYYNPSIREEVNLADQEAEARYLAQGYRAIAVTWREAELITATG